MKPGSRQAADRGYMDNNFEYRVYLKSLSKQFPTIADAATEIINLQAI
ncbi:MAG: hypothetical protein ACLURV_11160 [Gallintestinimicrobium sp.]